MEIHEQYMHRCIQLAQQGAGCTAPNPMVGAVLVYNDQIIGEGFHEKYGQAHAEVNAINHAIQNGRADQLQHSTLYVSLEPCAHFGKTPPCADLIIQHKIPNVVIGCRDPFEAVNGKGIEKLRNAGVNVIADVLKKDCEDLNKRFFTYHQQHRPYIVLKWAQTKNNLINSSAGERLLISNDFTNRLVHQWRSEEGSILVGTNTALMDDPQLTNRHYNGRQPVRLVLDKELKLPATLQLMNNDAPTIIFNLHKHQQDGQPMYYQLHESKPVVHQIINALYDWKIESVLVEGGAQLLQSFIHAGLWDEARVITNENLLVESGLMAPELISHQLVSEQQILSDSVKVYQHQ
jgi:diaminohydroxyphosphoribosylaminopyrimidine deaminase/5-amino-6-(5-phosphoribosylamino)uracil reductase